MTSSEFQPIERVNRDILKASAMMSRQEARYLVDLYYQTQEKRIRSAAQANAADDGEEPSAMVSWIFATEERVEEEIKKALGKYAAAQPAGKWALSIHGIGPVISAGLLAHIDIEKAPTVGHIWRFAGLDPTVTWEKGQKRPWNAALKRLCWIIGGSFVRLRSGEKDIYGKVYEQRKEYEVAKNEAGDYAAQAAASLERKRYGDDTQAKAHYLAGKLPPARIDLRARRYATKLFLSHLHHVMFVSKYGTLPPKPYIIEHGGHVHFIEPPHMYEVGPID